MTDYRGVITFDYNNADSNARNRLMNAVAQADWSYAETSSLYVKAGSLDSIRLGLAALAHGLNALGELSMLTVQVQLVVPDREPPAAANHRNALTQVLGQDLPPLPGPLTPTTQGNQ